MRWKPKKASARWLLAGLGTAILLQLAAVHTPFGHRLLGTTGLAWMDWLVIVLVASSIWVANEILKWFGAHGKSYKHEETYNDGYKTT